MTNDRHVEIGDIALTKDSANVKKALLPEYRGRFTVAEVTKNEGIVVSALDGRRLILRKEEYTIVSEQRKVIPNPKCPECKGTGKVLLFMFESPCSLCSSQRK